MNARMTTPSEIRSQLQAITEAKTEAEATAMMYWPTTCAIGTFRLIEQHRLAGDTVQDAAKRALEAM